MALSTPPHLLRADLRSPAIRYAWDEWSVTRYYADADPALLARLAGLSPNANLALACAVAEWIAYRFQALDDDPLPLQYIEAAWAAVVDTNYAVPIETDDDAWRGPVRGPLNMTITLLADALFAEEADPTRALNAAWLSRLAEHVLPDVMAFRTWREAVLQRLTPLFPPVPDNAVNLFEPQSALGEPVTRDAFDLDQPFAARDNAVRLTRFLAGLDWHANPFLVAPAEPRG